VGVLRTALWTAAGLALVALAQWAANGAHGLPAGLPTWVPAALPWAMLLVFGLFLAAGYGGAPGAGMGLAGAVTGIIVAGLPLAYAFGVAQHYGLPVGAGLPGRLLAGPVARAAGAVWAGTCLIQAWRARPHSFRLAPPPPMWTAPPAEEAGAAAYVPVESRDS
jgi:hypothetical protein